MTHFPKLSIPPAEIADPGTVRLGDAFITAKFPSPSETAPSTVRCPVTGSDQCRVRLCVQDGCYLRRLGYPKREGSRSA